MTQPRPAKKPRQLDSSKRTSTLLMLLATALLLPLLFPPFYLFFLAPIALLPFALCILRRPMTFRYLLLYYALGLAFFFPNLFWLWPVALFGVLALSLYLAIYFPLFAWVFHRLVIQFRLPATLALPLAWTSIEFIRATFLQGGFPWFILGNCLTPFPLLLQSADLFGVWTLTFLITLLTGFLIDLLRLPIYARDCDSKSPRFNPTLKKLATLTLTTLLLALAYSLFRFYQNPFTPGPRIAVIQENIPQSLKDDPAQADANFQRYLHLSQAAATLTPKPDLIAWPETMIPTNLNPEILHFNDALLSDEGLKLVQSSRRYDSLLTNLATSTNIPLLVGAPGYIPSNSPASPDIRQNLTFLYLPTTGQSPTSYAKIHLVPFGEYIAFRDVPLLGSIVRYFTPIDFDYSLTPGTRWTRFTLPTQTHSYTFATPICFEDTMPTPCRMMSLSTTGIKTDFLLNVSNDGWFFPTELDQHLQACQLRAVENRIPIARSVNTGDSGFINSKGQIIQLLTNPQTNSGGGSIGAIGTAAQTLPLDPRISLYSQLGDLLPLLTTALTTLLLAYTYARPRRNT